MAKKKKSAVTTNDSTTHAQSKCQQNGAAPVISATNGSQGLVPPALVICRNKYADTGLRLHTGVSH